MSFTSKIAAGALVATARVSVPIASAEELIDGTDPEAIRNLASGYGSATLSKDDLGDPMIEGRIDGLLYFVLFYGCDNGKSCNAIQFSTAFEGAEADMEKINAWNRDKRFSAAFLDEEGDVGLEYDVNLAYGVSRSNLDDTFDYWRLVLEEFKSHIDW